MLRASTWLLGIALVAVALLAWRPEYALQGEFARLRWLAGATTHATEVDGLRVVHVEAGQGPTVVLLHGFTGSKENWLPLMRLLAQRHRVLAPDLPGWGESTRVDGADYGYDAQATHVARWLAALDPGPVDLVGHSMGGGIAALVAAREPRAVRRLVLMDAGGVRFRDNDFGRAVLRGENPFAVADETSLAIYLNTVFDDPPWVPWPANRALIARRIVDADYEDAVLDRIGRGPEAFLPGREAARIAQPTLLLWCGADRVIDASAAEIYRGAIRGSRVRLLDGCNHMPMMEQAPATALAIEEHLD